MKIIRLLYLAVMCVVASQSFVLATRCPDLTVNVTNNTGQEISGGIWGNTGNLGSSGLSVLPGQTSKIGVYSQDYPGGDFGVIGNIQLYGPQRIYVECYTKVPAVDGCPSTAVQPLHMTAVTTSSSVTCSFDPLPTPASYSCPGGILYGGTAVTGTAGQVVCGNDVKQWICTPEGWSPTGGNCTTITSTCAGGVRCNGMPVEGLPNQVVCGTNFQTWQCTGTGWQLLGSPCSCQ